MSESDAVKVAHDEVLTRVGQRFRRTLVTELQQCVGEPAEVAAALERAYAEAEGDPDAGDLNGTEVDAIVDGSLQMITELQMLAMDRQDEAAVPHEQAMRSVLHDDIEERLAVPLARLRMLHLLGVEAGTRFAKAPIESVLQEALLRLSARAIRVLDEVVHLVSWGHGAGASARWRTLHEIDVTMLVLARHGEPTAVRYLEHLSVSRAHNIETYVKHHVELGEEPIEESLIQEAVQERAEVVERYGDSFKRPYGWASDVVPGATFDKLEDHVGLGRLRPHYQFSLHSVHASWFNTLNAGSLEDRSRIVIGPSADGLVDPVQLAALSFASAMTSLLQSVPASDLRWEIYVNAMRAQASRVVDGLAGVENRPGMEVPVPGSDDQSLIGLQLDQLDDILSYLEAGLPSPP